MPKIKKVEPVEASKEPHGFYKGYEIRWLRENPDHPDFKLVAEYDQLQGNK